MIFLYVFCSLINLVDWLQNHLIPCPFKALTGIDCPGCGFQRSIIALIQGDFVKSWSFYPPTIPILLIFILAAILYRYPIKYRSQIFKAMFIIVGNFIMISYLYKMLLH